MVKNYAFFISLGNIFKIKVIRRQQKFKTFLLTCKNSKTNYNVPL